MAVRSCDAVAFGYLEAKRATEPVTCGVAIDVPLYAAYELLGTDDMMPAPGAAISTEFLP